MADIKSLDARDKKYLWHPFTQMHDYKDREMLIIDRARGMKLYDIHGREYYDTISSWWCILHGHNHPTIVETIKKQLDRLDQVQLAGIGHEAAIELAEKLVELTPPNLTKVYYSDNGSCACEIAIKMSLQYWQNVGKPQRKELVALERGYHGDTIGTMSLGGVPEFHQAFADLTFDSHRLPAPRCFHCPHRAEKKSCVMECIKPLEELLEHRGDRIAALIIEPLIQAAGGMNVYPPEYLQKVARLIRKHDIHLVFDEVATGFGRTGKMFALEHVGVQPDFLCLSKGLTGGTMPLAATMVTEEIYQGFYDDYARDKTFFHGHTFTGNPIACSAALGSLKVFEQEDTLSALPEKINRLQTAMEKFIDLPWVGDLREIGMISALELVQDKATMTPFPAEHRVGWHVYHAGLEEGVILRPLGNVIYLWLPLSVSLDEIDDIVERSFQVIGNPDNIKGWK